MSSDLQPDEPCEEIEPKKASAQILQQQVTEGLSALERPAGGLFMSGLSAGLDVGFSLFLMAIMTTRVKGVLPELVGQILIANMYSVGFIFVVIGRSELFTEQTTLAVLPVLSGKASFRTLLRLWGIVYVSNLIGATIFAGIAVLVGPSLHVAEPWAFGEIAHHVVDHPAKVIFMSAVFAGWLMGLASWLVAAGRDTISQIVIVWLATTAIGFAGLHHSVLGTVEVMSGLFSRQNIKPSDVIRFLLFATAGNAFGGGFFVSVIKYGHARSEGQTNGSNGSPD